MTYFIQRSQAGDDKLQLGLKTQHSSSAQPWMPGRTDLPSLKIYFLSSKTSQVKNAEQIRAILRETCVAHYS